MTSSRRGLSARREPRPGSVLGVVCGCAVIALGLAGCSSGAAAVVGVPVAGAASGLSTAVAAPAPSAGGVGTAAPEPSASSRPAGPSVTQAPAAEAIPGNGVAPGGRPVVDPASRPVRLQIPAIGVDSSLVELGIAANGSIEVPTDWHRAGWLNTSSVPGRQGPAVIAGHVDSRSGPAVFARLSTLPVGAEITVTRADGGTARFTVDGVQLYLKAQFPTQETYGPVPGPALRLITCGGSYVKSAGGYQSNVVVFAS